MPSSGTYSFMMSRDDLLLAALRLCGAYSDDETPPPSVMTTTAQALNLITKEMVIDGLPLWCIQSYAITMIPGQATYNLSVLTGQTLPQKILDGYLTNSAGSAVQFKPKSRYDWDSLGYKAQPGTPNQCFYDPQLGAGSLIMYPVPDTSDTWTYTVVFQRQIQDFNLSTDNPDFPQEAFRLLKWCLADEIALEFNTPQERRTEINQKAHSIKERFFNAQQEYVSVIFTPSERQQ